MVNAKPRQLYSREREAVPIVQEAVRAREPVWTGAQNLAPHRDSIPWPPSPWWVAIPTTTFRPTTPPSCIYEMVASRWSEGRLRRAKCRNQADCPSCWFTKWLFRGCSAFLLTQLNCEIHHALVENNVFDRIYISPSPFTKTVPTQCRSTALFTLNISRLRLVR